uniref:acetyl-CoA carboxylase carboxyltransferase beta subunit n=1 Tax=Medicago granadensis TaxID=70947 RepID=UPI00226CEAD4|nr:acetyl-CoA carboxylase carboxyltransferase beta subunit [Medicago granadensis]UZC30916.1 acetyl-CoA carboxylase carboxyltransferase beta subunit [Medicago granadensis]
MEKRWFNSMMFKMFNRDLECRCGLSKSIDSFGPIENNSVNEDPSILNDMDNTIHSSKNNNENSTYNWNNIINSWIEGYLCSEVSIDSSSLDDSYITSYILDDSYITSSSLDDSYITSSSLDDRPHSEDDRPHSEDDRPQRKDDSGCEKVQNCSEIESTSIITNHTKDFSHLWVGCDNCYGVNYKRFFKSKMNICEYCGCHLKMSSSDRIELLIDPGTWNPMDEDMFSVDPIDFNSEDEPLDQELDPIDFNSEDEPLDQELDKEFKKKSKKKSFNKHMEEAKFHDEDEFDKNRDRRDFTMDGNSGPGSLHNDVYAVDDIAFNSGLEVTLQDEPLDQELDPIDFNSEKDFNSEIQFNSEDEPLENILDCCENESYPNTSYENRNSSSENSYDDEPYENRISLSDNSLDSWENSLQSCENSRDSSGTTLDISESDSDWEEESSENDDYPNRLDSYQDSTGLLEAIQTGTGQVNGIPVAIGIMDFEFMGGSMGSVVGEKITRLIEYATNQRLPLIIVCASGGARMQEGSLSLMQMAKISCALYNYQINEKLFYVTILTSPTTGGVTASFGMLGDIIIVEPDAYIAFAGKRVIEQTLNVEVPEGSQSAEFLFEKGLFDSIVPRNSLKEVLSELFHFHGFFPLTQTEK